MPTKSMSYSKTGGNFLNFTKKEGGIMYVLGRRFYQSIEELRSDTAAKGRIES